MSVTNSGRVLHKLFVGNVPWTISSRELRQYFSEFGHVSNASVVFDKQTGLSKGYAFVTYTSQAALNTVLSKPHHSFEGHNLIIQPAS